MINDNKSQVYTIAQGLGYDLTDEQVEEIVDQIDDDFTFDQILDGVKEYVQYLE